MKQGSPRRGLDRLAEMAARLLDAPSAQVSLLRDVQTIAAGSGLPGGTVGEASPLDESLCTVTASSGAPLIVVDALRDPRVADLPPVTSGAVGSYLGVPLTSDSGDTLGALCVFGPTPRAWSDADVSLLGQLAASTVSELELATLSAESGFRRVAWELAVQAAGVGTFDWDIESDTLAWDDRMLELFGFNRSDFPGTIHAFLDRLHPDDRERVLQALRSAIATCGEYAAEYRVVHPSGQTRWVAARGRALGDASGRAVRLLGAGYDTTLAKDADARVARVLESMNAAFFLLDREWRFAYVNGHAERLLGRRREELLGGNLWELFPYAVGSDFETNYRRAMEQGVAVTFEAYYPAPLDAWYEVQGWPDPDGVSVYFLDITARRAAQEQLELAAMRAHLLAEVTSEITNTLDVEAGVARLAELVVPGLADWCLVTQVDADVVVPNQRGYAQWLHDVGAAHADPHQLPLVRRYAHLRFGALRDDAYVLHTLRSSEEVVVPRDAVAAIERVLHPGECADVLRQLAPDSFVVLPLRGGSGRTVGLLTLFNSAERGPMSVDELVTAREVAVRAGLALDSARLYREQRDLAAGLQRSMLTEPPEPDHMEIAVRYTAAAETAQVGGDWYDAFLQRAGATVLVIGDVVGHDTAAAAAMGQVRTMLRAVAAHSGDGPAEVLRGVDRTMQLLQMTVTATVVVARIEQTADERERGVSRVRWSNAGHPPPMVINGDRTVAVLAGVTADLLLGIEPDSDRVESEITLDRGATVLLYTDGLVERRGKSLDDGLAHLRDTLVELAEQDLPLEALCDAVLERMLPSKPDDDVALVAVRLHPQDRARPVEAGPNEVPPVVSPEPKV